jgi:HAD superfamily hydrolase (TIGR01509 family)
MHVCLFDIDGTLLSSGGAGQAAMEAAIVSEFGALARYEGLSTAGRTDRAIAADLFDYHKVEAGEEALRRFIAAYLSHLPRELAARQGMVLPGIAALLGSLADGDQHLHRDDVAREAFVEVHRRLNGSVRPERVWVIGDTPADVRCARAIGVNIVAVATGIFSEDELRAERPDHLCADFSDPERLLSLLTR